MPLDFAVTKKLEPESRISQALKLQQLLLHKPLQTWEGPSTAVIEIAPYNCFDRPVYRLCIGELMPEDQRITLPGIPIPADQKPEQQFFTGTIGYVDFTFSASLETLAVLVIGIEPHAQRFGFASWSLRALERLAFTLDVKDVMLCDVGAPNMHKAAGKLGYRAYPDSENGTDYIKDIDLSLAVMPDSY